MRGAAYDVASVIIEVPPAKVFDTVKSMLGKNTEVRVTKTDEARRSVEFTDGRQIGGIQVSQLGDNLSQLMVSTAHPGIRHLDQLDHRRAHPERVQGTRRQLPAQRILSAVRRRAQNSGGGSALVAGGAGVLPVSRSAWPTQPPPIAL